MALALAILVFAGLFMLTSGAVLPAAVAAAIIFGVAAFHYVVWGWWLSGIIRQQVEDEEDDGRLPEKVTRRSGSASDSRHRAGRLNEAGLADVVLELLAPHGLANDLADVVVACARAHRAA